MGNHRGPRGPILPVQTGKGAVSSNKILKLRIAQNAPAGKSTKSWKRSTQAQRLSF